MATATRRERAATMALEKPPEVPGKLDANQFLFLNGRLPRVDDDPPAWEYRGYLLYYLQGVEITLNGANSRWAYYVETLEQGRLLDRAIPPIAFGAPDRAVFGKLQSWAERVGYDCGGWSDFTTLLDWICFGLGVPGYNEKPRVYKGRDAEEALYRSVDLTPLLRTPYDYLGAHISEHKARGWNRSGFYPTPHQVCALMDAMSFCDAGKNGEDARIQKVCDPCVGSGRMLLHASNHSLRLYGQDIDPIVLKATAINGALYAPWMTWPFPASLFPPDPEPEPVPFRPGPPEQCSMFSV